MPGMEQVRSDKLNIEVLAGRDGIAHRAVELFMDEAERGVKARGRFAVAVSGGRTPGRFFELLGERSEAGVWAGAEVFWADERYVPRTAAESNYGLAWGAWLSRVSVPEGQVHGVATDLEDAHQAARAYERTLCEVLGPMPVLDLVLLGMGRDGHTAALFPGFRSEDGRLAIAVKRPDGLIGVTLTPRVLLAARRLVVMVSGADKAETLKGAFTTGPDAVRFPIQMLWPVLDRVLWLVDREAVGLL